MRSQGGQQTLSASRITTCAALRAFIARACLLPLYSACGAPYHVCTPRISPRTHAHSFAALLHCLRRAQFQATRKQAHICCAWLLA